MTVWMCLHCGEHCQLTQQRLTEYLIVLWKKQKNNLKQEQFKWSFCNVPPPTKPLHLQCFSHLLLSQSRDYYTTLHYTAAPILVLILVIFAFLDVVLWISSPKLYSYSNISTPPYLLFNSMSLSHLSSNSTFFSISSCTSSGLTSYTEHNNFYCCYTPEMSMMACKSLQFVIQVHYFIWQLLFITFCLLLFYHTQAAH
jgi:hypothetical protein